MRYTPDTLDERENEDMRMDMDTMDRPVAVLVDKKENGDYPLYCSSQVDHTKERDPTPTGRGGSSCMFEH